MNLAHLLSRGLGDALRARGTAAALGRLDDRRLADIGLARGDVRLAARLAARSGPADVPLGELVRLVRAVRDEQAEAAARVAALPRLSREDLDRHVAEGRRLREREIDRLTRKAGRSLAGLGRALAAPVAAALEATGLTARAELALARRREYRRVRAELATYSERELMADLRLVPAEIADVAVEAADMRAAELARARRRRVARGGTAGAAAGRAGA